MTSLRKWYHMKHTCDFTRSGLSLSWTVVHTDSNVALSPLAAATASDELPLKFLSVSIVSNCSAKKRLEQNRGYIYLILTQGNQAIHLEDSILYEVAQGDISLLKI